MAQGFSCAFPSFSLGAGHGEGSWREQNKELTSKVLMTVNCQANDLMCTCPVCAVSSTCVPLLHSGRDSYFVLPSAAPVRHSQCVCNLFC